MAIEIRIPKLGLTMLDAVLVRWRAAAGQPVAPEQIVCEIETDKVSYEVPSPGAGLLLPLVEAGRRVEVAELIAYLAADEAELTELKKGRAPVETGSEIEESEAPLREKPDDRSRAFSPAKKTAGGGRIWASPAARAAGRELGLDLSAVSGSGPGGRIVKADVLRAAELRNRQRDEASYERETAPEAQALAAAEEIPIRGARKIIFGQMHLSLSQQAQLTLHTEASAEAATALRRRFNQRAREGDAPVSYNAFFVKAAAAALRRHPRINASADGRVTKVWKQVHIGVAMDFGQGLLAPKIRNADLKSIRTISAELSDLAERARAKKLIPDELQAGTFTITNLGGWGVDHFTPIVNFPESAILGIGRIVVKPWVRDGAVTAESRLCLSLTFDHRIIDGAPAAAFLQTVREMIEEPGLIL